MKKVLVAGTGKSGIASAGLLCRNKVDVVLFDENTEIDREKCIKGVSESGKCDGKSIDIILGSLDDEKIKGIDLAVVSPGIPLESKFVEVLRGNDIPIWSEIELAYHFAKGHLAACTGTNGKTTTVSLLGEIFKSYTDDAFVVGNIGIPYTDMADSMDEDSFTAAEISSFQLETIKDFRPHVSSILNLTPDHLNRHHTFENYVQAKARIAENQTKEDYIVLNYDDPEILKISGQFENVNIVYFSRKESLEDGVSLWDGEIIVKEKAKGLAVPIIKVSEIGIPGDHNVENYLAAIAMAFYMGVPAEVIRKTCLSFKGVEHRIEYVRTLNGVKYYNDSKGTNPDAAIKGIMSMSGPTCLIGGGYDKGSTFDEWIESFNGKVKALVLIGKTAEQIAETAKRHGFNDIIFADSLEEAVKICYEKAEPGDMVLLSPACASWDMFKSYEERGELFKKYVNSL